MSVTLSEPSLSTVDPAQAQAQAEAPVKKPASRAKKTLANTAETDQPPAVAPKRSSRASAAKKIDEAVVLDAAAVPDVQDHEANDGLPPAESAVPVPQAPSKRKRASTAVDPETGEPVAKKKPTTSQEVCDVINNAVGILKEQSSNAKANKDKETAATLAAIARELNSIRKPIDKLAKSKPVRKVSIDPSRNGFLRPLKLSPELAEFMGCEPDEMRSRVAVTQRICAYIRENGLQDPSNRRNIIVDDTLKRLLDYDPETEGSPLSYYHIQGRVQRHFIKDVAPTEA